MRRQHARRVVIIDSLQLMTSPRRVENRQQEVSELSRSLKLLAKELDVPVIAVPTSVGYGASFDGLAALLAMMNACSPGVAVVNIDNGFGAGYLASVMNR